MHEIADLARESLELEGVAYAVLTGVTAGVGLGLNRAMLFVTDADDRTSLMGMAAVGPDDREEADRVWKSIAKDGPDLRTLYQSGQDLRSRPKPLDARVRKLAVSIEGDSPIALAFRNDAVVCGRGSDDLAGMLHRPTAIAAPLRGRHNRLGVLYADNLFTGQALDEVSQTVFGMVAGHAGRALDNARSYEQVLRVSQTDSLTGLPHHGALMDALGRAVDHARGNDQPLSVVMLDLDDFKGINDTLGHLVGDRLLAEIAHRLRQAVRGGAVYRYGGEEFTALLTGVDRSGARLVAERLRRAVHDEAFLPDRGTARVVTCSLGVATLSGAESAGDLLRRADSALLLAKRGGKNRVVEAR